MTFGEGIAIQPSTGGIPVSTPSHRKQPHQLLRQQPLYPAAQVGGQPLNICGSNSKEEGPESPTNQWKKGREDREGKGAFF